MSCWNRSRYANCIFVPNFKCLLEIIYQRRENNWKRLGPMPQSAISLGAFFGPCLIRITVMFSWALVPISNYCSILLTSKSMRPKETGTKPPLSINSFRGIFFYFSHRHCSQYVKLCICSKFQLFGTSSLPKKAKD